MKIKSIISKLALMTGFGLLLCACGPTQVTQITPSGFLGDYSKLTPGDKGNAVMLWQKPGLDLRKYDKIILEPVRLYLKGDAANRGIEPKQLAGLTEYAEKALVTALTRNNGYTLTETPGPDVLYIRTAITDVVPGNPVRGTLGTLVPVGLVVSTSRAAVTGAEPNVGQAAVEIEIVDSATGDRLAAAMDSRAGGKGAFKGELDDAKDAFTYWAERLRTRLDQAKTAKPMK